MSHEHTVGFGELLRRHRIAAGLTQDALAERAGLSTRGISDLERGARTAPQRETLRLLAHALALSPAERTALKATARRSARQPPPATDAGQRSTLPLPPTPLVGRDHEVVDALALLRRADVHLMTVTGPGGVGKTRLALEVGRRFAADAADGVVFVPLASLTEPSLVLPTIAAACGLREDGGHSLATRLRAHLAAKRLLLLLDNFEHVAAAAPLVADVLTTASGLTVLVTSRERLHLRGEREYPLQPLALPGSHRPPSYHQLAEIGSIRLFVDRAREVRADFAITGENASAVSQVCHRLDGLPLALELAAARIKLLSPAALLTRLEQRLPLLTGGARDLPIRHQTMRDAIAWSYELLTPAEQSLFRRLAVFAGGFTLDAVERVLSAEERGRSMDARSSPSTRSTQHSALDLLASLIDKSLVRHDEAADDGGVTGPRFAMLETIREFARERLEASGGAQATRDDHAQHFLSLAESEGAFLTGAARIAWMARLEAEQANLRVALAWLRERGQNGTGLRLATALAGFWYVRGSHTENRGWLETFLPRAAPDEVPATVRVVALQWAGELAGMQDDAATAAARLTQSLALAREAGDERGVAAALAAIGSAFCHDGDVAASIVPFTEALALSRRLDDPNKTAFLLAYLAVAVGHQGDLAQAEALTTESEELVRSLGEARSYEADLAVMLHGWVAFIAGDEDRARRRLEAALTRAQTLAAKGMLSATRAMLGYMALAAAQEATAAGHFHDGLAQGWEAGYQAGIAFNLPGLARIACRRGEFALAARLIGTVDAIGRAVQTLSNVVLDAYEADVSRVRDALGEEAFTTARAAGRALPLEQAVAEALTVAATTTGARAP